MPQDVKQICKSAAERFIADNPVPEAAQVSEWLSDYGTMILASWAQGTQIARNRMES